MGHDFWLQFNNGSKEQLGEAKHGVRKEQVDKKFQNLFDAYDANSDGTLEDTELQQIFGHLKNLSGDNVLDASENKRAASIFAEQVGIQDADFQGFVKSISDASEDILSSEETVTDDGGKEIKTKYKDGTTETIAYYPNGDFKWKKIEKRFQETTYEIEVNGQREQINEEQYKQGLSKLEEMRAQQLKMQTSKMQFGIKGEINGIISSAGVNRTIGSAPDYSVNLRSNTTEREENDQRYSSRFIAELLGVNINSEDGKKVIERLSYLPQEALDQIKNGKELKDLMLLNDLTPSFDNISNVLELIYGVTLRNAEELEAAKPQMERLLIQIKAAEFLTDFYSTVAEWNDQYTDNLGLFGLGAEGIGYLLNKLGLDGENHYQWADSCREFAERASNLKVLNPKKFNEGFKKIYGENSDKWGINFNEKAFKDLFALIESGKAVNEKNEFTEEYKAAISKAVNFVADNPNESTFNQVMNGLGECLIMIMTLGWGAGTKGGQMLATTSMSTFSKAGVAIASRRVNNRLLQGALRYSGQAVKLIGPAINEGTKMYAYTVVMGTASNAANRAIKFDSEGNSLNKFIDTEVMVLDNAKGSFAFGAFAGVYGATVTQKVVQSASRVSQKVGVALSDKFAKGAVDANEVFATILEKSAPTKIAEAAAFATDVLGFTGFETAMTLVNNMEGFPDNITFEDVTNLLWEEFKGQGINLGQIKGVSYLIMWMSGSRSARMQASKYMQENPQFKGTTVEKAGEGFKINLPDGRKVECKNTTEMISSLHLMSRGETALSYKFKTLEEKLRADKDFPKGEIGDILKYTNEQNIALAEKLCSDKEFPKENIGAILKYTNERNVNAKIKIYERLRADKEFPKDIIQYILDRTNERNIALAEKLCSDKEFPKNEIGAILRYTNEQNIALAEKLCSDKEFPKDIIQYILDRTNERNIALAEKLCSDKEFPKVEIGAILRYTNERNIALAEKLCSDKEFPKDKIGGILEYTNERNVNAKIKTYERLRADKDFPKGEIGDILKYTNEQNIAFVEKLCSDKEFPKDKIGGILEYTNERNVNAKIKTYERLRADKDFPKGEIGDILYYIDDERNVNAKIKIYKRLCSDKEFPKDVIGAILKYTNEGNIDYALELCQKYKQMELGPNQISIILANSDKISPKQIQKLNRVMGRDKVCTLSNSDVVIACNFVDLYQIKNINEIPQEGKKDILRSLVKCNSGMFTISEEMQKMFPLIPTSQEAYCELLPSIVRSLGIETAPLTPEQRIAMFNSSMVDLSKALAQISDADFANLHITQEISREDFIKTVKEKVKDLSREERQKVFDYYGFELHHNKANDTGFTITGYAVNLNNGKKLAQIEDPKTKAVVENLRQDVINYSTHNPIRCENKTVERFLNEVVACIPELRSTIGKAQHGTHDFDVMQHSLKVMQKITQDFRFNQLNESDKKIMLLASLLHDITKLEGSIDKTHANESSFDTFFIAKKFNLSKEEEIKLYKLCKHHEWLEYVNTSKSEEQLTKRLQSVAFDFQQDNLIDMAVIFTHADLKAVKADDTFHDTKGGKSRVGFDGSVRSFGEVTDIYVQRIKEYVAELQKSQPLLPITKVPTATTIESAITKVNSDGSTNIKGVYKDKDGLIIIKFNEVEDWEAIGFPKGSVSRGYKGQTDNGDIFDTGNIKFIVHGLDDANQLAKFDAFSLIDSDVLLSVSYSERPESKFRFFRPQGVLLDVDTKYIYGGGNTDSGSGCGKSIKDFKSRYIFGGERESDRLYISDLIKKATGMSEAEYTQFAKKYANKTFNEIEPADVREKIIKAFASINSNTRKGNREYNEMYASNPNVMGVFAYNINYNENIGNPVKFLNRTSVGKYEQGYNGAGKESAYERTEFLRQYALEHNLPFIIFGD